MKLSAKRIKNIVIGISATLAAGLSTWKTVDRIKDTVIAETMRYRHMVDLIVEQNSSYADMFMALMDKIEGEYYLVDDGGAVHECLLFETAEKEPFAILEHDILGWVTYPVFYNDNREQWYFYRDEDPNYEVIYKR